VAEEDNNFFLNFLGGPSPVSSDAATTARASSIAGLHGHHNNLLNNHDMGHFQNSNSYYHRSDDSTSHNLNISPSNENVMFREKKDFNSPIGYNNDRSPVETTTEL